MSATDSTALMDPATATSPSDAALTQAERSGTSAMNKVGAKKEKRRVVRRDPDKRRQQNLQAQKKYSEFYQFSLDTVQASY